MSDLSVLLAHYVQHWGLTTTGPCWKTASSCLQPVRLADGRAAMLKVTADAAEQRGGRQLLGWQKSGGAVPVYAHGPEAFLLAWAPESRSALALARSGGVGDDLATRLLGANQVKLHEVSLGDFTELQPLAQWFTDLLSTPLLEARLLPAQRLAEALLATPQSCVSLHGDGHHDNLLCFGPDDWRVIDPKGLCGEHYFDYAPILANPDLGSLALAPQRFERQLALACTEQDLDPQRLAQWTAAAAALSAVWFLDDGLMAQGEQQLALMALALCYV
ncbi:aminoglycoside phosphotransferase family protein [Neisseriaceae bacterium CLB008]